MKRVFNLIITEDVQMLSIVNFTNTIFFFIQTHQLKQFLNQGEKFI